MKNKNTFFVISILSSIFLFSSCSYGFWPLSGIQDKVDQRAPVVTEFSEDSEFYPDVGSDKTYTFIAVSDIHFGKPGKDYEDSFLTEFTALCQAADDRDKPKFLVCLGDLADHGLDSELSDCNAYFDKLIKIADDNGISDFKIYSCIGNHDTYNYNGNNFVQKIYPYKTSYQFTAKSSASKSGNLPGISYYFLDTGNGTLGKKQMESLKAKIYADASPKIIFTHYPVFAGIDLVYLIQDYTERNLLLSMFGKNYVKLILGGHQHELHYYDYNAFQEFSITSLLKKSYFKVKVTEPSKADGSDFSYSYESVDFN